MRMLDLYDFKFWGNKQLTPMLLIDEANYIYWHNRWAEWLFRIDTDRYHLLQLPAGDTLAGYADSVRKGNDPSLFSLDFEGLAIDVEASRLTNREIAFKFHPVAMSRDSMLEMHKFMQDFALEAGDRVNNPLTTVLNCLQMIRQDAEKGDLASIPLYAEMAIREAFVMKEFGDWVRRLSEEPFCQGVFDLLPVLEEVLERRACEQFLQVIGDIPPVRGCPDHARTVLGGLVNLSRQAAAEGLCSVIVCNRRRHLVTVEINSKGAQVRDLRMLTEEFYGGLGLMAARYLLSLMQAQIVLNYMGDVGIQVTFLTADALANFHAG
ncbi:MAG: hypothetical protein PHD92_09065 [Eubacteriales bacterium]|nr:hypothetical protein [Eubacteriales bacterium]MDD4079655.1 hypothetical protein [Eubacteriales bacterium]